MKVICGATHKRCIFPRAKSSECYKCKYVEKEDKHIIKTIKK
jgi:hypothetical protein